MKAQKPAEGILKTEEWGPSKLYHIKCDCGDDECSHDIDVEADEFGIHVHIYTKIHTKWWEKNRWLQIWQILTKGYTDMEATIILKEQVALNYAETLKNAIKDVKHFKSDYWSKKKETE